MIPRSSKMKSEKGSKVWPSARRFREVGFKKWKVERGAEKQNKQSSKEYQDQGKQKDQRTLKSGGSFEKASPSSQERNAWSFKSVGKEIY